MLVWFPWKCLNNLEENHKTKNASCVANRQVTHQLLTDKHFCYLSKHSWSYYSLYNCIHWFPKNNLDGDSYVSNNFLWLDFQNYASIQRYYLHSSITIENISCWRYLSSLFIQFIQGQIAKPKVFRNIISRVNSNGLNNIFLS